jgi:hypothetical protein
LGPPRRRSSYADGTSFLGLICARMEPSTSFLSAGTRVSGVWHIAMSLFHKPCRSKTGDLVSCSRGVTKFLREVGTLQPQYSDSLAGPSEARAAKRCDEQRIDHDVVAQRARHPNPIPHSSVRIRGRRTLAELTGRQPGRDGVDCPACLIRRRQLPEPPGNVGQAASAYCADPLQVAQMRTGRVSGRSNTGIDLPMHHRPSTSTRMERHSS